MQPHTICSDAGVTVYVAIFSLILHYNILLCKVISVTLCDVYSMYL